ncbi:MAG: exonuclease domain-containing protein [Thermonemataceae bacterium]
MAKQLDQVLVIDVEATCWEDKPPEGQQSEIIEIGVAIVATKEKSLVHKEGIIIKPEYSEVSPFCTSLTTLTPEMVASGVSFKDACKRLRKEFMSQQCTWVSYGDYDRRQFERDCREKKVGYPFGTTHLNVKNLLALMYGWEREVGMATALEQLQLPLEGTHHRGIDDAWNIAKLFVHLLECFQKG